MGHQSALGRTPLVLFHDEPDLEDLRRRRATKKARKERKIQREAVSRANQNLTVEELERIGRLQEFELAMEPPYVVDMYKRLELPALEEVIREGKKKVEDLTPFWRKVLSSEEKTYLLMLERGSQDRADREKELLEQLKQEAGSKEKPRKYDDKSQGDEWGSARVQQVAMKVHSGLLVAGNILWLACSGFLLLACWLVRLFSELRDIVNHWGHDTRYDFGPPRDPLRHFKGSHQQSGDGDRMAAGADEFDFSVDGDELDFLQSPSKDAYGQNEDSLSISSDDDDDDEEEVNYADVSSSSIGSIMEYSRDMNSYSGAGIWNSPARANQRYVYQLAPLYSPTFTSSTDDDFMEVDY